MKLVQKATKILLSGCAVLGLAFLMNVNALAKDIYMNSGDDLQATLNLADGVEKTDIYISFDIYTSSQPLRIRNNTVVHAQGSVLQISGDEKGVCLDGVSNVVLEGLEVQRVSAASSPHDAWGIRIENSTNVTLKNCRLSDCGILSDKSSDCVIDSCSVKGAASTGIRVSGGSGNTIRACDVQKSGSYGIMVDQHAKAVIENNYIGESCSGSVANEHGEGLLVNSSNETIVRGNNVNATKSNIKDNGNGIIIARSNNVQVLENSVYESGNHGIQVSYQCDTVIVADNSVSNSGRMGISVSRGCKNIIISGDSVYESKVCGIVLDGHEGRIKAAIDGCYVSDTHGVEAGAAHIACYASDATITDTYMSNWTVKTHVIGLQVKDGSDVAVMDCGVTSGELIADQSAVRFQDSTGALSATYINNYANPDGVVALVNSNVTSYEGQYIVTEKPVDHLYYCGILNSTTNMTQNDLSYTTDGTETTVQCYFDDTAMGAIIGDDEYESEYKDGKYSNPGGKFVFKHASTTKDKIYVFAESGDGTLLAINAAALPTYEGSIDESKMPDRELIGEFVERMYTKCLGRNSDEVGKQDWVDKLAYGLRDGASLAEGFFMSEEFIGKNFSNDEFLKRLYATFFDREPDKAGYDDWMAKLESGYTRRYVLSGFLGADEYAKLCDKAGIKVGLLYSGDMKGDPVGDYVCRLYFTILGRGTTPDDMSTWIQRIKSKEWEAVEVARVGFFSAKEYTDKYISRAEYIRILYNTFLGRSADYFGKADWYGKMANGRTRDAVLDEFAGSQEFLGILKSFGL